MHHNYQINYHLYNNYLLIQVLESSSLPPPPVEYSFISTLTYYLLHSTTRLIMSTGFRLKEAKLREMEIMARKLGR